jgi:hypothetical protein
MASLKLCEEEYTRDDGVIWACFIIEYVPTVSEHLRLLSLAEQATHLAVTNGPTICLL